MARRKSAGSMVRMGSALAIPDVLRSLGADPVKVLGELGYDLTLFDDAEKRISYAIRNRLLSHCAVRSGCPHFGLLVGQRNGLHTFGLLGLLMKHAPDVQTALGSLVRHSHLHVQGASVSLAVEGNAAVLTWQVHEPGMEAIDHIGDATLATLYNIMHELCGTDWRPTEVWFAHHRPADVGPFRRLFRVPLRFDCEQYALLFSAGFLRRRLPGIDEGVRRLLQSQIELLEERHLDDFPEQVRSVLRTALLTGNAKVDQVAALFGMHARTLHRHLDANGAGFQQLLDETRFEIARQMLEYSDMEIAQVSDSLGYAAPGAFTRAFRRWTGTTPVKWRATPAGARLHPSKGALRGPPDAAA